MADLLEDGDPLRWRRQQDCAVAKTLNCAAWRLGELSQKLTDQTGLTVVSARNPMIHRRRPVGAKGAWEAAIQFHESCNGPSAAQTRCSNVAQRPVAVRAGRRSWTVASANWLERPISTTGALCMRNAMTRRMARSWLPCNARQGLRVHAGFIELRTALGQPTDGIHQNAGQVAAQDLDRAEGSQCRDCALRSDWAARLLEDEEALEKLVIVSPHRCGCAARAKRFGIGNGQCANAKQYATTRFRPLVTGYYPPDCNSVRPDHATAKRSFFTIAAQSC